MLPQVLHSWRPQHAGEVLGILLLPLLLLPPTAAGIMLARAVAEAEGVSGLYRGLGTASVRLVPMAIVSFASYEWVRRTMDAADARRTKRVGIEVDVA